LAISLNRRYFICQLNPPEWFPLVCDREFYTREGVLSRSRREIAPAII
jgi:hypothetical protein